MHKTIIILSLLAISGFAAKTHHPELNPLWGAWKTNHKKEYSAAGEDKARFAIFVDNYYKILKHNSEHASPRLGLGKFADLTAEEFKARYSGCGIPKKNRDVPRRNTVNQNRITYPDSIDWRECNAVTPIKSQEDCGSCWAFATTGALESYYAITQGQMVTFSEQQLIDCDDSNNGCEGGNPSNALDYTANNGIITDDCYPYNDEQDNCQYQGDGYFVNTGHEDINENSVDDLKSAVANGPVTVLIESTDLLHNYESGVIDADSGCGENINHVVLIVGYGEIDGQDAWIIKNSWGDGWGDQGYFYISTDGDANGGAGVCGILKQPAAVV